jgi:hypothetical protein
MGRFLLMFCILGLLAKAPTLEAKSSARFESLDREVPWVTIVQIQPGIIYLSYSVIQGFFEVASARLGPVVPLCQSQARLSTWR